ncbi:MAG TPA: hypothetical protein VHX39_23840, partial [Acetobacteraceae bacterium]|nr:hypothetical protein [Acetobacteraceae bacterium]
TSRRTLSPVAEIMPDRCTPEYERVLAKMEVLLPYRRAWTVLSEFLPLGRPQTVATIRRRTLCVVPDWRGKPWRPRRARRQSRRHPSRCRSMVVT